MGSVLFVVPHNRHDGYGSGYIVDESRKEEIIQSMWRVMVVFGSVASLQITGP